MGEAEILDRLFSVIDARRRERPEGSYVVSLLDGGVAAVAAKVTEEAEESADAALSGDAQQIAQEVADLVFHAWVLLAVSDLEPRAVYAVLEERFGVGGLVEKAARGKEPDGD